MEKDIRHVSSAIEDLAFTNCSSREFDKVGRRVCIERDDEGMASKILTRAEDMLDGKENLKSRTHTKWKRASLFDHKPGE